MVLDQARGDIIAILKKAGVKAAPADVVFPPDAKMGDLSFPLFAAAKERGVAPVALAQEVVKKIKPTGLVERIEAAGPYLNFWLKRGEVAKVALAYTEDRPPKIRRTVLPLSKQRIMLEMVQPNTNKPLHLGHLRNAFIGESVSRLLESQGAKVIRTCIFNDRGLIIAKAMLAYKRWAKGATPESARMKGDQFVVQWYVRFEEEAKKEQQIVGRGLVPRRGGKRAPTLHEQAEELVRKWEEGDRATFALWKKMAGWALEGINATLKRISIKFEVSSYESKLWKEGKKVVAAGLKKGVFKKDETGAVLVEFGDPLRSTGRPSASQWALPPKVLLRADGTAIYVTSDLALAPWRFSKYKLSRSIWCVGQEQDLYFKQLFTIYQMLGYKWADSCEHLTYGLVFLPEGKMKTREGTVVEADPLLDHMVGLVRKEIKERHTHLTEREIEERAEIIAQAAVRYYLLKVAPQSAVHFDPKASIAFTGDTGPYLLYTYARIASILRKSNPSQPPLKVRGGEGVVMSDIEWHLILQLARFPEIMAQSAVARDPSHLAKYLFAFSQQFSDFYEQVPVLKAEESERAFRLALISAVQRVLKDGLHLLTIETLEEM